MEPEIFAAFCAVETADYNSDMPGSWTTGADGHGDPDD